MATKSKITEISAHIRDNVFPAIVARAIDNGLSCEPADRPRAERALREVYRLSGLNPDVPIYWANDPIEGVKLAAKMAKENSSVYSAVDSAVSSAVGSAVYSAVDSSVWSAVWSAVYPTVRSAVMSAVMSAVRSAVGSIVDSADWYSWRGGQFWISWPAYVEAIEALGVDHPSFAAARAERAVCESAGPHWPNREFIVVCERPKAIVRDGAGRLHNEHGPSLDYGQGQMQLFHWHGTAVPREWIEDRASLTAEVALSCKNVEQRRAACEMLGWVNVLKALKATIIDSDPDPMVGSLVEVSLPDAGRQRFLRVLCGTGREFAIPVPPDTKSAIGAQAWTWGLEEHEFIKPEIRT